MSTKNKSAGTRGEKRRRIMRQFKMLEISGVDHPAQEGARVLLMKRKGEPGYDPKAEDKTKRGRADPSSMTDEISKSAALTTENADHTHLVILNGPPDGVELSSGETTWQDSHTHPWVRTEDGILVIGIVSASDGQPHTHEIAVMSKVDEKDDSEKKVSTADSSVGKTDVGTQEDYHMADNENEPTVAELQAQLARVSSVANMTDVEKNYFNALDEATQTEFLSKSIEDRKVLVDKAVKEAADVKAADADKTAKAAKDAKDGDQVVYTTTDGIEIRKSAGEAFIAMAKSNDVIRKENVELREARENDALTKRAEDLEHIPGDVNARKAMLKAMDGIKDKTQREAALNALKAQDAALGAAYKQAGTTATPAPGSPDDELVKLAKSHQAKSADLTYEQAFDAVLKTDKGRELYTKSIN